MDEYCLARIFEELDFVDLLPLRRVCTVWCSVIDRKLKSVKELVILGSSCKNPDKIQYPFNQSNCQSYEHQKPHHHHHNRHCIHLDCDRSDFQWRKMIRSFVQLVVRVFCEVKILIVDCSGHWIPSDEWKLLGSKLEKLEHVNLINCSKVDEMTSFTSVSLQHLELHDSSFYDESKLSTIVHQNSSLRNFLSQSRANRDSRLIFNQDMFKKIRNLTLIGSFLRTELIRSFIQPSMGGLISLTLSFITNLQLKLICISISGLKSFQFWSNLAEVGQISQLTELEELIFACTGTREGDFNTHLQAIASNCGKLKNLSIKCSLLDNESIFILSHNAPELTYLRLIECSYKNTTAYALEHLKLMSRLRILEITHTKIDEIAISKFLETNKTLILVSLVNNSHIGNKLEQIVSEFDLINLSSGEVDAWSSVALLEADQKINRFPLSKIMVLGRVSYENYPWVCALPTRERIQQKLDEKKGLMRDHEKRSNKI
ncbi:uncharacterized protein LOC141849731 [Brevipalpus obovatus]|uniref:uncharacterized protein LOC141849731 n=1 Tax=Brevipalpus obovatus TaxID=246614 RepID=UPI003D9E967E